MKCGNLNTISYNIYANIQMHVKYFVYSTHYACMNSIKHYADDDGDVVFVMMIFDIPLPLQFFLLLAFESTQESCSVLCFMRHY